MSVPMIISFRVPRLLRQACKLISVHDGSSMARCYGDAAATLVDLERRRLERAVAGAVEWRDGLPDDEPWCRMQTRCDPGVHRRLQILAASMDCAVQDMATAALLREARRRRRDPEIAELLPTLE